MYWIQLKILRSTIFNNWIHVNVLTVQIVKVYLWQSVLFGVFFLYFNIYPSTNWHFTSMEWFACRSDPRSYVFEAFCPGWVFRGSLVLGDGPDQKHLCAEKSRHRWAPFPKTQACWAPGSQALAHGAWISHMGPPSCGPTTCRRGCRKPVLCVLGSSWNQKLLKGGVNNLDFRQHGLKPGLSMININHILLFLHERKLVWLTLSMFSFLMNQAFTFVKNLLCLLTVNANSKHLLQSNMIYLYTNRF